MHDYSGRELTETITLEPRMTQNHAKFNSIRCGIQPCSSETPPIDWNRKARVHEIKKKISNDGRFYELISSSLCLMTTLNMHLVSYFRGKHMKDSFSSTKRHKDFCQINCSLRKKQEKTTKHPQSLFSLPVSDYGLFISRNLQVNQIPQRTVKTLSEFSDVPRRGHS